MPRQARFTRALALSAAIITATLVLFASRPRAAEEGEGKPAAGGPPAMPPAQVEVASATPKSLPRVEELVSRVESPNTVEIVARVEGFLEQQLFEDGALVKKDQLLFKIEDKTYRVALSQAKAELARAQATLANARKGVTVLKAKGELMTAAAQRIRAEKDLARVRPLAEASAISRQELDSAQAAFDATKATEDAMQAAYDQTKLNQATDIELADAAVQAAKAGVEEAELRLSYTNVKTPIAGRVGRAQLLPGSLVGKDMAAPTLLVTVSPIDPMWATWSISEQEYLALLEGTGSGSADLNKNLERIELVLSDGSVYKHAGRINFVDRAIDPKTGTLALRGEFPNPEGLLREGQYCRVRQTWKPGDPLLMVPQRAINELQGESFVFVVKDDSTVDQRKVKTGDRNGSEQVVLEGLKAGERVIVSNVQRLRQGSKVEVVAKAADAAAPGGAATATKPAAE